MTAIWEMANGDWQHVLNCEESRASTMHTLCRNAEPNKLFKVSRCKPKPVY